MSPPTPPYYAGFWRRLAAFLIDSLLFAILSLSLFYIVYGQASLQGAAQINSEQLGYYRLGEWLINWLLPFLLTIFFWLRFLGTPGKLLMNCKIVDARSKAGPTTGQAVLRYVGYFASALPLGLGFLWIIWDRRKQGFHDKIAGTVVVLEDISQKSLVELERELRLR